MSGAAEGNANAMRSGHRSQRFGLVLANLGKRSKSAMNDVLAFRRALERKLTCDGEKQLSIRQRARIQTACRYEAAIRAMELEIREHQDLSTMDQLKLRESIIRWSNIRDSILTRLGAHKTPSGREWNELEEDGDPTRSFQW